MRHTRAHTANRRSHHALANPRLSTCKDCGAQHLRHQMCANCGKYRGRVVIDVQAIMAKKQERFKRQALGRGEEPNKKAKKTAEKAAAEKGSDKAEKASKRAKRTEDARTEIVTRGVR